MAQSESQMGTGRRWSASKQGQPVAGGGGKGPAAGGQAVVEFSPLGSKLVPYQPGSIVAANNANNAASTLNLGPRFSAVRKIRNDISDEERQEILMAFELFDSRKCGKLNSRELKVAMRALDFNIKKGDVRKIIHEHTNGRSDEIDQDDFMEILTKKYKDKDPEEDLAKAFKYFDEDNTGKISLKNLRKIAKDLGENITDEELAAMIDEFDKDGDGESFIIWQQKLKFPFKLRLKKWKVPQKHISEQGKGVTKFMNEPDYSTLARYLEASRNGRISLSCPL